MRTLVETQVLVGERGTYRLVKALPSIQVPVTVQAVLAARIDRLTPEDKRLLQTAAVIGTDVPFTLLQATGELPEEALRIGLTRIQAAEFLYETRLFPDLEYTFAHALTHEVTYGSLLQERRRALHARIVEAIEALSPEGLAEQVERLAQHAFRGEVWGKAVTYFRQAGAKAFERSANRDAVACYEQALVALQHIPDTRDTRAQAIDLRFDLRNALLPLGEHERIFEHLRAAEMQAQALDDHRRLGRACAYLTTHFFVLGEHDRAIASGRRALALTTTFDDLPLLGEINFRLGQVYHALGDYQTAMGFLRRNLESAAGPSIGERFNIPVRFSRIWLIWCLVEVGAFAEGFAHAEEAVRVAEAVDHHFSLVAAYHASGLLHLRKGDVRQAIPVLERGLLLAQASHIRLMFPTVASALGSAMAVSGHVAEGLSLLEQAVEQAVSTRTLFGYALFVASLGEAHLLAGRLQDAISSGQHALEFAQEHKERGYQAWVLRLLGEIAAHRDPPEVESAEGHYRQALALAEEIGMRPLSAHCHLGFGTLYLKIGRLAQARAELLAAIELYRAMEMTFYLSQAEATLAQVTGSGSLKRGAG